MAYGMGGQRRVEPDRARITEQREKDRAERDQFEEARALINQAAAENIPQGLASIGVDDFTDFAMRTRPFVPIAQPPAPPEGTPNVGQGFDPKNTGVSSTVKGLAELLGYNMDSREGLAEYFRDTALADKAYRDQQEMRNKDRDRALAAAAQNQPIDPCPEGYRLDPVSKVCVPTDDTTTDTAPGTGRVYETLQEPVPNYTAASNIAVPTITLPDILTGN